jgi:hypothetical protein
MQAAIASRLVGEAQDEDTAHLHMQTKALPHQTSKFRQRDLVAGADPMQAIKAAFISNPTSTDARQFLRVRCLLFLGSRSCASTPGDVHHLVCCCRTSCGTSASTCWP